nr:YceD family protein [Saccharobesus litoralis]
MPIEIDPIKSAQKRSDYSGVYLLENLKRLNDITLDKSGVVDVELCCKVDEQGLTVLLVDAQTDVLITCERCGGEMPYHLTFSTVFTPESKKVDEDLVPAEYEIVAVDEFGLINLRDLVEDELILSLPNFPKHEIDDCLISQDAMSWGEIDEQVSTKPNPFDVLKKLKTQKD